MGDAGRERWAIWTRPQRAVVAGILILLLAWYGYRARRDRMIVPIDQVGPAERAHELDDRLDPNVATVADLAMLPGIGEQTARDIVAYREQFRADGRGDTAYAHDLDLLKVKGVGRGTVREAATYLRFPTTRP